LFNALKSKRIAYSGIDVFENEPKINFNLAELSNVLLTPHIAGKTVESYRRMAVQAAKILINYF
jgi:D-3-phosphoglycerate dehydrogenase